MPTFADSVKLAVTQRWTSRDQEGDEWETPPAKIPRLSPGQGDDGGAAAASEPAVAAESELTSSRYAPRTPPITIALPKTPPIHVPKTPPIHAPKTPPIHVPKTPPIHEPKTPPIHVPKTPPLSGRLQPATPLGEGVDGGGRPSSMVSEAEPGALPEPVSEALPSVLDAVPKAPSSKSEAALVREKIHRAKSKVNLTEKSESEKSGSPTLILGMPSPKDEAASRNFVDSQGTFHATESEAEDEEPKPPPTMKKPASAAKAKAKAEGSKKKPAAAAAVESKAKPKSAPMKRPSARSVKASDGEAEEEGETCADSAGSKPPSSSITRFNDGDWIWEEKQEGDDTWREGTDGDWKA